MKTIKIRKAVHTGPQIILDTKIVMSGEPPNLGTLQEMAEFYDKQAKELANALEGTLPGGTFNRLLAEMLIRKAGHFAVSYGAK